MSYFNNNNDKWKNVNRETIKIKVRKQAVIQDLCEKLDVLYFYAKELIPKDVQHNLGYEKEILKQVIEKRINEL